MTSAGYASRLKVALSSLGKEELRKTLLGDGEFSAKTLLCVCNRISDPMRADNYLEIGLVYINKLPPDDILACLRACEKGLVNHCAKGNFDAAEALIDSFQAAAVASEVDDQPRWSRSATAAYIGLELDGEESTTALHSAAVMGNTDTITMLISSIDLYCTPEQKSQVINKQTTKGNTALHKACLTGRTDCINALLDAGADITPVNSSYMTAYDLYSTFGRTDATTLERLAVSSPRS